MTAGQSFLTCQVLAKQAAERSELLDVLCQKRAAT